MLNSLKALIKRRSPRVTAAYRTLHSQWTGRRWIGKGMSAFHEIYRMNVWNDQDSISGSGSSLRATEGLRASMPSLLSFLDVRSVLDAPCGDFHWMAATDIGDRDYIGADLVGEIVEKLELDFGNDRRRFICVDVSAEELPHADLILCRDCLVHFSYADIYKTLANFRGSGAKFLATTTYPNAPFNVDCPTGHWRALNLQLAPFCFPKPVKLIWDDVLGTEGKGDKSLAVWRLDSLPIASS